MCLGLTDVSARIHSQSQSGATEAGERHGQPPAGVEQLCTPPDQKADLAQINPLSDSPCWNRQVSNVCSPRLTHSTPREIEPSRVVRIHEGRIDLHHRDRVGIGSYRVTGENIPRLFLSQ